MIEQRTRNSGCMKATLAQANRYGLLTEISNSTTATSVPEYVEFMTKPFVTSVS